MQRYVDSLLDRKGNALRGATVTVKTESDALASIYADNGSTSTANPLETDDNGQFSFYAADGRYSLEIYAEGFLSTTLADILLFDSTVSSGGGGMSNPMTAAGDVIIGGTSGAPARRGIGSTGQVLTVVAGAPAWTTPSVTPTTQCIPVACSDETTALTTGTAKVTFRMPFAFTVTAVKASLTTAQASGSLLTVDVNEAGVSILSTRLTFDNTEKTTATAATAPVLSDTAIASDAEITVDIDQVGDGTAKGLKVYLIGTTP